MLSSKAPKNAFWIDGEKDYDSRQCPETSPLTPGCNFWFKDDMEYDKLEERGRGAFAKVYRAKETITGRVLAIKTYQTGRGVRNESQIIEAAREGPHIIRIGTPRRNATDKILEMPMDFYQYNLSYLMHETRKERGLIKDFILIPSWYYVVMTQMLEALEFLHSKKVMVIHRDVTPQNILYNTQDHFVLAGFSQARIVGQVKNENHETRSFHYLAPEIYNGREETTMVDIWALGILCLDMLRLLPKIEVHPSRRSFALFKRIRWYDTLSFLGRLAGRPEVKMMIERRVEERSSASVLLGFVRSSSNNQPQRYRPTVDFLEFFFREDRTYGHLTVEELHDFAVSYLENPRPPPPPVPGQVPISTRARAGQSSSGTDSLDLARFSAAIELLASVDPVRARELSEPAALRLRTGGSEDAATTSRTTRNPSPPRSQGSVSSSSSTTTPLRTGAAGRRAGEAKASSPKADFPSAGSPRAGSPRASSPKAGSPKAGKTGAPTTSRSESKFETGRSEEEQAVRKGEGRPEENPKSSEATSVQSPGTGGQLLRRAKTQGARAEAETKSSSSPPPPAPPSRQPRANTQKSGAETKKPSPPSSRPTASPTQPGKTKADQASPQPPPQFQNQDSPAQSSPRTQTPQKQSKTKSGQASSSSTPEPQGRETPPESSPGKQTQPEQSKAHAQKLSSSSTPESKGQEPSRPSSHITDIKPEQAQAQAKAKPKSKQSPSPSSASPPRAPIPPPPRGTDPQAAQSKPKPKPK